MKTIGDLLDRYHGRITVHVGEHSGGTFDVPLTVDGVEIACLRVRLDGEIGSLFAPAKVQLNRSVGGQLCGVDHWGNLVPLPAGNP